MRLEAWDVFRDIPDDPSKSHNEDYYNSWNKVLKLLCIVIFFIFVLGCALLTKATLLFVTSQIRQNITLYCNSYTSNNSIIGGENNTQCVVMPIGYFGEDTIPDDDTGGEDVTPGNFTTLSPTTVFVSTDTTDNSSVLVSTETPEVDDRAEWSCIASSSVVHETLTTVTSGERQMCQSVAVRWLWCLLLIMVTPYLFVFLRSAWNCCFKTKKNPSLDVFFLVSSSRTGLLPRSVVAVKIFIQL